MPEAHESALLGIKQRHAALTCADPQPARMIQANHAHGLEPPPHRRGKSAENGMKLPFERVTPDHRPAVGGDPQAPGRAELHVGDEGVGQSTRVSAGLTEVLERIAVEAIQAVLGAEPHKSRRVLRDGQHGLLGQAVVDAETLEAHRRGHGGLTKKRGGLDEQRG